jgi:urocanate hydratase
MLMNNLDPAVAERPEELIVYGGGGKAARNWECYEQIVATLRRLENDETLLVQSGKPVGVFRTHDEAPRVLIANAHLVPRWATWDEFRRLEALGLTMYGQMTAGSWIYIGTQGILQGTYETFAECARQHFGGSLEGRLVVTGGLGGMGGAQPLAATMNGAAFLGVDVDESHIPTTSRDRVLRSARARSRHRARAGRAGAVGTAGPLGGPSREHRRCVTGPGAAGGSPRCAHGSNGGARSSCGIPPPRAVTRGGGTPAQSRSRGVRGPGARFDADPRAGHARTQGPRVSGIRLRQQPARPGRRPSWNDRGVPDPGVRPRVHSAAVLPRRRALPVGGALGRHCRHRRDRSGGLGDLSRKESQARWIRQARDKVQFQGLPARICWLEYGERAEMGLKFNWLVRTGRVRAPIVIGRDHLDTGSVASPNRETEAMKDGSDAIADWPLLNALLNTACGASWVSIHHGGGVGIGYSIHAGMVAVADGTVMADRRLERVLTADPGTGVMRHADAGYELAIETARERGVYLPMLGDGR